MLLLLCALSLAEAPPPPAPVPQGAFPEPITAEPVVLPVDLSSPEATLISLVQAIRTQNIDAYAACFDPATAEREGQVSRLRADPKGWAELQGIFAGPQKLQLEGPVANVPVSGKIRGNVAAPKADQGGIGAITFVRTQNSWLVHSW
ncbi:MAG TPA: hypothetical protein PLA94_33145 [Myxococcota bacterium]|nr:hypothetical protein [Myxococcota bacterium]